MLTAIRRTNWLEVAATLAWGTVAAAAVWLVAGPELALFGYAPAALGAQAGCRILPRRRARPWLRWCS